MEYGKSSTAFILTLCKGQNSIFFFVANHHNSKVHTKLPRDLQKGGSQMRRAKKRETKIDNDNDSVMSKTCKMCRVLHYYRLTKYDE